MDFPQNSVKGLGWFFDLQSKLGCFPVDVEEHVVPEFKKLEWQRLVCCKELLHILDSVETRVSRPEDIERLVEKIVLPADLQDPFTDGIHALTDRVAATYAAAILFPFAAREIVLKPFLERKLPLTRLADMAELPPRYVAIVMSEIWPEIHKMLVA